MGAIIAVINKKRENAAETAVAMLKMLKDKNTEAFGIASPTKVIIEKSIKVLQNQRLDSPLVIGHVFSKILAPDKPQPIKLDNATLVLEGRIYPTSARIFETNVLTGKQQQRREASIETFIRKADGNFAFVLAEQKRLIAGRDAMGVYSLYYGENADLAALASERKALWRVGIETVESFPPGHIAFIENHNFRFKHVKTLSYSKPKQTTINGATKKLQKLLQQSIIKRVSGLEETAVAFSGGLDSSIIAFLAKKTGANVHLIHVNLKNQPETEQARRAAEELKLPIHVYLYEEKDVEKTLKKVLWSIEEPDPLKASIGIPVYWAAEKAAEMKFNVMLAGQGADELFGGYKRYVDDYLRYGSEKVHKAIFNDVVKMYETNFERDFKICNFHNVELRLPFATYQMARFAVDLPVELKIDLSDKKLRKLVLRRVAQNLGLPQLMVDKPKRAIQYATGVNKALEKLAKNERLPVKDYIWKMFQKVFKKERL